MLKINRIYNMDCLEGLKQLDDNSIDLVITDPPYDLDMGTGTTAVASKQLKRNFIGFEINKVF